MENGAPWEVVGVVGGVGSGGRRDEGGSPPGPPAQTLRGPGRPVSRSHDSVPAERRERGGSTGRVCSSWCWGCSSSSRRGSRSPPWEGWARPSSCCRSSRWGVGCTSSHGRTRVTVSADNPCASRSLSSSPRVAELRPLTRALRRGRGTEHRVPVAGLPSRAGRPAPAGARRRARPHQAAPRGARPGRRRRLRRARGPGATRDGAAPDRPHLHPRSRRHPVPRRTGSALRVRPADGTTLHPIEFGALLAMALPLAFNQALVETAPPGGGAGPSWCSSPSACRCPSPGLH